MAVYSSVSDNQMHEYLAGFSVGNLREFTGIDSGIENTNYFVDTDSGRYVLTIFERLGAEQLPYYLNLMHHLATRGIACPLPISNNKGQWLSVLNDKPAALVTRLAGTAQMQPSVQHCARLGSALAKMHLAAQDFKLSQPNLRGLDWWRKTVPRIAPQVTSRSAAMLEDELAVQSTFASSASYARLPRSAVHADLFRDNVLFIGTDHEPEVGGIIDFYFAGTDTWIFDLAVTVNDWCLNDADGSIHTERLAALLSAYRAIRPFNPDEQLGWPFALRSAALRFWVSRLDDAVSPRPAQVLTPKDPLHFERILTARRLDAVTVGQALTTD